MSFLELLTQMRAILYQRYNQYYPILDAVTLFSGMDAVYFKYADDGKLYVTLVLDIPPKEEVKDKPGFYQESVKP